MSLLGLFSRSSRTRRIGPSFARGTQRPSWRSGRGSRRGTTSLSTDGGCGNGNACELFVRSFLRPIERWRDRLYEDPS
eukprot:9499043-Pyramimonas_sp.AAC.1